MDQNKIPTASSYVYLCLYIMCGMCLLSVEVSKGGSEQELTPLVGWGGPLDTRCLHNSKSPSAENYHRQ